MSKKKSNWFCRSDLKIIPFQFIPKENACRHTCFPLIIDKPNYLTSKKHININQVQNRFIKQSLIIYDS